MIRRIGNKCLQAIVYTVLLIEELFWATGRLVGGWLSRIPFWQGIEMAVLALPARAVFVVLLLPMAMLLPMKVGALWLMAHHHVIAGVTAIVLAKIMGTAVSARLFLIAKPKLLTLPWFALCFGWITGVLSRAHAWLEGLSAWRRGRVMVSMARRRLRRAMGQIRTAVAPGGVLPLPPAV